MDQSNTIHSFVAVIGDIKDSRLLENRKEVQLRLQEVLERLNENYKEEIVSRRGFKLLRYEQRLAQHHSACC